MKKKTASNKTANSNLMTVVRARPSQMVAATIRGKVMLSSMTVPANHQNKTRLLSNKAPSKLLLNKLSKKLLLQNNRSSNS